MDTYTCLLQVTGISGNKPGKTSSNGKTTFYPPKRQEHPWCQRGKELRTGVCEALGRDLPAHPGSLLLDLDSR